MAFANRDVGGTRDLGAGRGFGGSPIPTVCSLLPCFLLLDCRGARGRDSYTSGRARADQAGTAEGVPGVVVGPFWEGTPSDGSARLPDLTRVRGLITLGRAAPSGGETRRHYSL